MTPVAAQPMTALRDLREIHDNPTLKGELQRRFLDWLEAPEHQSRQMRGFLFGRDDRCCALGGPAHVLAEAGFDVLDTGAAEVEVSRHGPRIRCWASTLPEEVGAALDWELGWISNLNDEGGRTFTQLAQTIRETDADQQSLPF